jgi:coproporphyrinogen III oxidase
VSQAIQEEITSFARRVRGYFEHLQQSVCSMLENVDRRARFTNDSWTRQEGGGGLTRVMEGGAVFEKAGVNTSTVFGTLPDALARTMNVLPVGFCATGISLVIHPQSPLVPTVHANYRYFEQVNGDAWFGGGSDLTPYYVYDEDVTYFHTILKRACDAHDLDFYPRFKKWCDEYFFIRHRGESRGVGGIFFDYLRGDREKHFSFVQSAGNAFAEAYMPIVNRRSKEQWSDVERTWQLIRRGRYAEFNLVYDRGTRFGLETNGRIESVLMSLPPLVQWRYGCVPDPGTREAHLIELLQHPKDWVQENR